MNEIRWAVSQSAIAVMILTALFTVVLPLGLGLWFRRRTGGRWRFFLLGAVIFPLFALVLEGSVNRAVLGSSLGGVLAGNLWLYALYGGLAAGIFEECGRYAAFRVARKWSRGPGDALMYGAGHGGIEAVLLTGVTMVNNIVLSLAINRGGLEAVEQLTGPLPESTQAALAALTTAPAGVYLWSGFERLTAVVLHIALSVLVYAAVTRRGQWYWFPAAIALHALVDMAAVVTGASCPIVVTEVVAALAAAAVALLAWRVYRGEPMENA